jgi:GNAT superfamily N-acetyltransferase
MLREGEPARGVTDTNAIELVRLYVLKDHIGLGVGAALMQACLDQAKTLGHKTIWLGVWERNYQAQAFYRRWGFTQVGTHIFQLGDDAQTDFVMERPV